MDILTVLNQKEFDYELVHAFFAENSTHTFLVELLKQDNPSNRKSLVREVKQLLKSSQDTSPQIDRKVIRRAKAEKQLGQYLNAPLEIQDVVYKKNYTYRLLADQFSQLKALALQELGNSYKKEITLVDALQIMDSRDGSGNPSVFSLVYVNLKGEVKTYQSAILNKLTNRTAHKYSQINRKNNFEVKKRYWKQNTRRIYLPESSTIKSVLINQIVVFNDMQIVWA